MTAVLIPVHNQLDKFKECWRSLTHNMAAIHVYDDASDEETADYLHSLDCCYYLRNEEPRGYAHHLNTFAMWCVENNHNIAVVCNSDTVWGRRSLERLVKAAKREWEDWRPWMKPWGALFCGPSLSYAKSGQGEAEFMKGIDPVKAMGPQLDRLEQLIKPPTPKERAKHRIPTVNGAAFAFSPAAWVRYGPWDERFGRGSAEEEEWMRRVNRLSEGERGLYVPHSVVYHYGHASFGNVKGLDTKALWRKNRQAMLRKEGGEEIPDHALMGHPREWPVRRG